MDSFTLVKASAGSGKTRALVVRYLSLLFLDQSPSKILALTFTNKAVGEMKERIMNVVYNLRDYMDYVEQISEQTSLSKQDILSKKEQVLDRFLNSPSHILTIDKFFNKILRLFCWYDDISIDFNVKTNTKNIDFVNYFLDNIDTNHIQNLIKISKMLNIGIDDIILLFFILLEKDDDVLSLINTNQIIDRDIEKKIFDKVQLIKNIVCNNEKSSNSAIKAFDKISSIQDVLNKTWVMKASLQEYHYFKKIYTQDMDDIFLQLKNLLKQYCEQEQIVFLSKLLSSYTSFKKTKKKYQKFHNELSFDDITNSIYSILQNEINTDFLYFRLDSKISHILIDEFQDTSILQYKILQPIINEILSGDGYKSLRTLFFVGDDKQSIYRFRGARKELVKEVEANEQIKTSILDTNYRSHKSIIDLANKTFSPLYKDYMPQKCNSSDIGYARTIVCQKDEIKNTLIQTIKQMLDNGYLADDITILSFKNNDLLLASDWIKEELKSVKTITDISSKLIKHPSVRAIIEFINYIYFKDEIYIQNFLHLTSKSNIEEILQDSKTFYEIYEKDNDIGLLVLNIIKKYDLYNENTLIFLEKINHFKDMIDFIFNIEDMDSDIASSSTQGIRLSTIHKSKGLEFDNVILLEQISGEARKSSKLLFSYEDIHLQQVYLNIKNRNFVDDDYAQAIKKEEEAKKQDLINSLYVAITRAKKNIFIIQKNEKSKFSILDLREESIGVLEKTQKINKEILNKKDIQENIKLKSYGLQSDFLHKEDSLDKDINVENIKNIEYGNAMHYMFESLHFLDKDSISTAYELTKNKYGFSIGNDVIDDIKKTLLLCIEDREFQKLISDKTIKKELSFKYNQQIGIIDLLLEDDKNTYIIDYKTSSSNKTQDYIAQIHFYKKAMTYLYKKPSIGYLFFVNEQKLIEIK